MSDDFQRRLEEAFGRAPEPTPWMAPTAADVAPGGPVAAPARHHGRFPRWLRLGLRAFLAVLLLLVLWLTFTAPLSGSLQPLGAPSVTVLAANGDVIARRGARIDEPVDVRNLPPHVAQAFIAIEDRRFFRHLGVDPWGLARAMWRNVRAGRMAQGGSTITQQLAKTSFTGADRTAWRKVQEGFIAFWLEAWLSKEEILSRYLSNVYFGDNVYGLRAASLHYFSVPPEELTREQAIMLAGVVNAPSRLAPTRNLEGARARARLVARAMTDAGYMSERDYRALRPARLRPAPADDTPSGTYFADWVLREIAANQDEDEETYGEREIRTTLDPDLQQAAERIIRNAGLGRAQAALVAMRTDGRIVAMVGGRNYRENAFNRATQARRQSGSTFKLFTYLAALRQGWRPDSMIDDTPLALGDWRPANYSNVYRGRITLAEAVAQSSNVATVRLSQRVGLAEVIRAARDLGVTSPLPAHPSLPLGTAGTTLLEMTAAYAAVAAGTHPVRPRGLDENGGGWLGGWFRETEPATRDPALEAMRELLAGVVTRGTGTAANLSVPTYGKTGTTQDYRDALFIGFAEDLVVGVWIGNDDNRPLPGITGGSAPARIWRAFMTQALGVSAGTPAPRPVQVDNSIETNVIEPLANEALPVEGEIDPLAPPPSEAGVDPPPPNPPGPQPERPPPPRPDVNPPRPNPAEPRPRAEPQPPRQ
jgi:penicillin-binding protein 1A